MLTSMCSFKFVLKVNPQKSARTGRPVDAVYQNRSRYALDRR